MNNVLQKKELRTRLIKERNKLSEAEVIYYSKAINEQLITYVKENSPQVIHTFLPMGKEVNIVPFIEFLLQENKVVVTSKSLPKRNLKHLVLSSLNELENGIFGTKYPTNNNEFNGVYDLIIVPGLAFDTKNNRLGYGAGYYDSFMSKHKKTTKIGVCFPFQLIENVPIETHDINLNNVFCG